MKPKKEAKKKLTMSLPKHLRMIAGEWAGANEQSLSTLVEYLLRRHLEENGVNPNLPAEKIIAILGKKFNLSADEMEELRSNKSGGASSELQA